MTNLCKMMLDELKRRNYSDNRTRGYLRYVERSAQHVGKSPDKLGPDLLHLYLHENLRAIDLQRTLRIFVRSKRLSQKSMCTLAG